MFKKPFKIKSNNALRSSDRRKIYDRISRQYPDLSDQDLDGLVPKEGMSVAKLVTSSNATVTCVCANKTPVFFELDDGLLLPTVYALWMNPCKLLCFTTYPAVFSKVSGGADLLMPGVVIPPEGLPMFDSSTVCYVTVLGNGAAVALGLTGFSSAELQKDGVQGKRVKILHYYKDFLWSMGQKTEPPLLADVYDFSRVQPELVCDDKTSEQTQAINGEISDNDKRLDLDRSACDVASLVTEPVNDAVIPGRKQEHGEALPSISAERECKEECRELADTQASRGPSSQETMDELLENCLCQAILNAKNAELPILVSTFSTQYLHPVCPEGQRLDVKKSSYKKMSKFLQEMQKKGLIEVKEQSKGVDAITMMSFDNEVLRRFKRSEFALLIRDVKKLQVQNDGVARHDKDELAIRELYAVSAKTVAFFKLFSLSKSSVLPPQEIRKHLTDYVKSQGLVAEDKRHIILDPLLTDVLIGKGDVEERLSWDAAMSKLMSNMNVCHEICLPGLPPVIKKGRPELIEVTVEQRMGSKKVTLVKNLEVFGIDVKDFAQKLQQAAASSTTVNALPGCDNRCQQVLVQGVQTKHVKNLLDQFRIPPKFVLGLDSSANGSRKPR